MKVQRNNLLKDEINTTKIIGKMFIKKLVVSISQEFLIFNLATSKIKDIGRMYMQVHTYVCVYLCVYL